MLASTYIFLAAFLCISAQGHARLWTSTSTPSRCTEPDAGPKGNECHSINVVIRRPDGSVDVNITWHGYLPYVNMAVKNMNRSIKDSTRHCEVRLYNCETHGDCSSNKGVSLPSKDSRYAMETCTEERQGSSVQREEVNVYGPVPTEYQHSPVNNYTAWSQTVWESMYRFGLELLLATVLSWHYTRFQNPFIFSFGLNGQG